MSIRKMANANAHDKNILSWAHGETGCCGSAIAVAMYDLNLDTINVSAIKITVNGSVVTKTFPAAATTEKALRSSIAAVMKDLGYDAYYEDEYRGIITKKGYVALIGDMEAPTALVNGGSDVAFTKKASRGPQCMYRMAVKQLTDPGKIKYNGSAGTQVASTAGWAIATAVATVKTAFETALTAEGLTGKFSNVHVTKDTEYFYVTMNIQAPDAATVFTLKGVGVSCTENFVV